MVKELKGTEKQVSFANDIMQDIQNLFNEIEISIKEHSNEKTQQRFEKVYARIKSFFNKYEEAGKVIKDWKHVLYEKDKAKKIYKIASTMEDMGEEVLAVFTNLIPREFYN